MRHAGALVAAALLLAVWSASAQTPVAITPTPLSPGRELQRRIAASYDENCAGCHGAPGAAPGRAPDLFDPKLFAARTDPQLHATIHQGLGDAGMPAFAEILPDERIWQLIAWLRIQAATTQPKPVFVADPTNVVVTSDKQTFRLEVVAGGLETPWGLAFLPDGRMLVTERPGRLRIVSADGRLAPAPVAGTPRVWERQDGGMLDVAVHPDFKRNGWVYIAYSELRPGYVLPPATPPAPGVRIPNHPSMTIITRGRIDRAGNWTDTREIFRAPTALYTSSGSHYGARLGFDRAGALYFTLGDRGDMRNAQDLASPLGKIHRVTAGGGIPPGNPFARTPGALPSIWSWGHRNPQGLAWTPAGKLWATEHGPTGGDEINLIEPGHNYGWGVISAGIEPGITRREAPGMEQPRASWTPGIAPSGAHFYTGNRYPRWKNSLFVATLAGQHLRRLEIEDDRITAQEIVFKQFGRVRAVTTGPDGLLYVLLQNPTGGAPGRAISDSSPGMVVRLVPMP